MATVLLAGRRPDPADADAERFPISNAILVRERLYRLVEQLQPAHLVCSAACGADLLALDVAGGFGVARHVVLPFDIDSFRESSVVDRPGQWGHLYDRIVREVAADGRLSVLDLPVGDDQAYADANQHMLALALQLGDVTAVPVWEGTPRGDGDLTAHLVDAAAAAAASVVPVLTL